jgi:hypothetical protein
MPPAPPQSRKPAAPSGPATRPQGDFDDIFGGANDLDDPFGGKPSAGPAAPPPPPPPPVSARQTAAPSKSTAAPSRESELDQKVASAVSSAPGLVASLYRKADLGVGEGATDEASRIDALRRSGLADLPADKLRALIARARG